MAEHTEDSGPTGQLTLPLGTASEASAAEAVAPPAQNTVPAANSPKRSKRAKGREAVSAETLATQQRSISVSEFFAKNRHLLGFDNKRKALLTTVKEAVDNSLDACEEAGHLPDVEVAITQVSEDRFQVTVRDNGPGIVKQQIPNVFGKLLYGSKFHRLKMSRGQQGIGISAAGMYGLLTTGKPVRIISRTGGARTGAPVSSGDRYAEEPTGHYSRRDDRGGLASRHRGDDRVGGVVQSWPAECRGVSRADRHCEPARGVRFTVRRTVRRARSSVPAMSFRPRRRRSSRTRMASSWAR